MRRKNPAAVSLGRRGGKAKSDAKAAAVRKNARRPRRAKHPCPECGYGARETAVGYTCRYCGHRW